MDKELQHVTPEDRRLHALFMAICSEAAPAGTGREAEDSGGVTGREAEDSGGVTS